MPVSERIAGETGMIFKKIIPTLTHGVYYDNFHTSLFTYLDGINVCFGVILSLKREYIVLS